MTRKYQVGLIGLAVMGANLARNIARNGFTTLVYNRTPEKTQKFVADFGSENLPGSEDLEEFMHALQSPRKVILMVKAGKPVDDFLEKLLPFLEADDIVLDCGNSHYPDTIRREKMLQEKGIYFLGTGVSGGEEGALKGPSIMPGGDKTIYAQHIAPIFEAIAANDFGGGTCVSWIGENGAGHYVKMVHNGIEYGVMQILAEVYDILRKTYGLNAHHIAEIFTTLHQGKLESFLTEISIKILQKKDDMTDGFLIDKILDKAGQKGTGKWTVLDAVQRAIAVPTIAEAVNARIISSQKTLRQELEQHISPQSPHCERVQDTNTAAVEPVEILSLPQFTALLEDAISAAMLSSYAQGYALISAAATEENWSINLAEISRIWQGGCIIRARILEFLQQTFVASNKTNIHLLQLPQIASEITQTLPALRSVVAHGVQAGAAIPALSTSLAYLENMRQSKGSANFIQGLRDFFGAHTFERNDREGVFHANWEE